jgi:hypothetical protein
MAKFCVVGYGKVVEEDTREWAVLELFDWSFDAVSGALIVRHKATDSYWTLHGYTNEWTDEEKYKDVVRYIFAHLSKWGYRTYYAERF